MSGDFPRLDDVPSRLGKAMLLGAWAVGIALLAMLFNDYLEGQRNPNRSPVLQSDGRGLPMVELRRNRLGHYVASGAINGEAVEFLLDTGATTVSIPQHLARRLGLPLSPGGMSRTANGMVRTWTTLLDSVSLGGLEVRRLRAVVMPNMPGDEVLLGMSFLKRFDLIQRGGTLILRVPG